MNTANNLSPERIAEIMAFQRTDFNEYPVQTEEELKEFRPKHPENFRCSKIGITNNPSSQDIADWVCEKMAVATQ